MSQSTMWRSGTAALATCLMVIGCRSGPAVTSWLAADRTPHVSRIVVLWSEAVLREQAVPMAQGFCGKIYLFGTDGKPIQSPGTFSVYAYDESDILIAGWNSAHVRPDRSWRFQESELRPRAQKDPIGWSYPLWIPHGPPEAISRNFTLLVRFTPKNGPSLVSDPLLVTLPPVEAAPKH